MYKKVSLYIFAALTLILFSVQMPLQAQPTDQIFNPLQSFGYSNIYGRNFFGSSVGMSADGSRLIAGGVVDFYESTGIVRTYRRGATQWEEEHAFFPSDLQPDEVFGEEVAISRDGNTVLFNSTDPSIIYTYAYLNNAWTQLQTINVPDPNPLGFTQVVSLHLTANGDMALITLFVPEYNTQTYAYNVLVYTRSGNNWVQQPDLLPSNPGANPLFGYDLAFTADTNTVFVGAPDFDNGDGRVIVLTRSGNGWTQTGVIQNTTSDNTFAHKVAVNGDGTQMLIGSSNPTTYVYAYNNNSWTQTQILNPPDPYSGSETLLSEDGSLAMIAADGGYSSEDEIYGLPGRVYVYARENGAFVFKQKLEYGGIDDNFGATMALSSDNEVAFFGASAYGAPGEDEIGSVHIWLNVSEQMRITSFTLVDARTNQDIRTIEPFDTIDVGQLGTEINIRANTSPANVGSVIFSIDENARYKVENGAPYSIGGDTNGDYKAWSPPSDYYSLTATPYTGSKGTGTAGLPLSILIQFIGTQPKPRIVSFTLVNATTNQDIRQLTSGEVIDLRREGAINIRANTEPALVDSVKFESVRPYHPEYRTENSYPYALAGDSNGDYYRWRPIPETYYITATPYYNGLRGQGLLIILTITNSGRATVVSTETDLLNNGDFEGLAENNPTMPYGWQGKGRVKCGEDCAVQLKAGGKLSQAVEENGVIAAGNTLTLHARVAAKNTVEGGRIIAKVWYTDGSRDKLKLDLAAGTYTTTNVSQTLPLAKDSAKIKLMMRYAGTQGRFLIDEVRLTTSQALAEDNLLPLPLP
jgi:hypothetical protein